VTGIGVEPHLASIYEAISDEIGDAPALVHGGLVRTWVEFEERAARLSSALSTLGLQPGSVVAIDLYNCSEFVELFLAAIKGGFVPTMVNYRYRAAELTHLLTDAGAEVVFAHPDLVGSVHEVTSDVPSLKTVVTMGDEYEQLVAAHDPAPRRSREGEGALLSYTGGTTGLPKGVVYGIPRLSLQSLSTRWLIAGVESDTPVLEAVRDLHRRGTAPVMCPASPMMHSTAFQFATLPTLASGGAVVTLENPRFDADGLLDAWERQGVTATALVGDAFARPLVAALDERAASGRPFVGGSLRSMCSAGVAFSADTKRRLLEHLPELTILDACGSTEGAFFGTSIVRAGDDPSTASFEPADGTIIVDAERHPLHPGEVGFISAYRVTSGYHNQPEATAAVFYEDDDGGLRVIPGDLGRIEADGSLTLLGRGSSVINTGGEKVHPEEVEAVIKTLPGVVDALVGSVPDERLGSTVGALVMARPGSDVDESTVHQHVRALLAGYKAPRQVVFVDAIPRHANGKIDNDRVAAVLSATTGGVGSRNPSHGE